jgi:predicted MFS family arabinose efflux permease
VSRWSILAVLSLIRLSFGYQFQSMAALAPAVSRDLGLDQAQAGGLIGLYWAGGVLMALPGGWLGTRFGEKRMVLTGGALAIAGGALCAFGESYGALASGRLIAGLGGIVMNILAVKMASDWFAGREIGFALGVLFGSFPLGIGLGLALQAPLAEAIGWRVVMLTTAALAAVVVAAIAAAYRAPAVAARPAGMPIDTALDRREIALVSISGIGLALYNGCFLVYVSYAPMLLVANGFGIGETGLILAAASALSTVCLPLGGLLADRSRRPLAVLLAGTGAFCVCMAALPAVSASQSVLAVAVLALLISAVGSAPVSPMVSLPAEAIPSARRASGLGIFYSWFYLGATLCPPLGGWLYDRFGTPAAPVYMNAGLGIVTAVLYLAFAQLRRREAR